MAGAQASNVQSDPFTERLALLAEELAEAAHVIGKILRHGAYSRNPLDAESPSNIALLERELGHVFAAKNILLAAGDLGPLAMNQHCADKLDEINEWLHCEENRKLVDVILAEA